MREFLAPVGLEDFESCDFPRKHGPMFSHMKSGSQMPTTDASSMRRVLLVEDDDTLRANYEMLLNAHRLRVHACATKAEAAEAFSQHRFDVIILDVTLGDDYEAGF